MKGGITGCCFFRRGIFFDEASADAIWRRGGNNGRLRGVSDKRNKLKCAVARSSKLALVTMNNILRKWRIAAYSYFGGVPAAAI